MSQGWQCAGALQTVWSQNHRAVGLQLPAIHSQEILELTAANDHVHMYVLRLHITVTVACISLYLAVL